MATPKPGSMLSELLGSQKELLVVEFRRGESFPRVRHMRRIEVLAETRQQAGPLPNASGSHSGRHGGTKGRKAGFALPLQPRDLRMIDPTFANADDPSFLVRRTCAIVNLQPVRAMITCQRVLLFPQEGVDGEVTTILERLKPDAAHTADNADMPFELRALEAFFVTVVHDLQDRVQGLTASVKDIVTRLGAHDTSVEVLAGLRETARAIAQLTQRCTAKRTTLMGVLDHPSTLRALSSLTLREDMSGESGGLPAQPEHQAEHTDGYEHDREDEEGGGRHRAHGHTHGHRHSHHRSHRRHTPAGGLHTIVAHMSPRGAVSEGEGASTPSSGDEGAPPHHTHSLHLTPAPPALPTIPSVTGGEEAAGLASPLTEAIQRPRSEAPGALHLGGAAGSEGGRTPTPHPDGEPLQPGELLDYRADVAELLVEAYVAEIEAVIRDLRSLSHDLEGAEKQVNLLLATTRNRLLQTDIGISLTTMVLALLAAVYGAFGMNVPSGMEDDEGGFVTILWASCASGAALLLFLVLLVRSCVLAA